MRKFQLIAISLLALFAARSMHSATCSTTAERGTISYGKLLVDHYITDIPLHHRWAVLVDCAHPDRPWTLHDAPWQNESLFRAHVQSPSAGTDWVVPSIRVGARVRLWHMADGANINLSGIAMEAGAAGQTIHVRTGEHNTVLEGRVSGVGSVELLPAEKWLKSRPDIWSAQ